MRFDTPEEVIEWADKVAAEDLERHKTHGIDLNPYCTDGREMTGNVASITPHYAVTKITGTTTQCINEVAPQGDLRE